MQESNQAALEQWKMVSRDMNPWHVPFRFDLFRPLSSEWQAVEYRERIHRLTQQQREMYNRAAAAWQAVLRNIDEALLNHERWTPRSRNRAQ